MNRHPYLLSALLALTTLTGIVGMMLVKGSANAMFFAIAALPIVAGAVAVRRGLARDRR